MKIAILSPYPTLPFQTELRCRPTGFRGTATWTVTLADALAHLPDTEVHVVTETEEIAHSTTVQAGPVRVHFVRAPARFKTATLWQLDRYRLQQVIRQIGPDVVHGQGIEHQYGYAAVTARLPHLITIHGSCALANAIHPPPWFSRMRLAEWLEARCLRRARNLVVINPFIEQVLPRSPPPRRLFHIPNAVAEPFFDPPTAPRQDNLLLSIGAIERLKGADILLRAVAGLPDGGRAVRIKLIGQCPPGQEAYRAELETFARDHGLQVDWAGYLTAAAIARELRQCTALVHASHHENAPMAIAEALSTGTPVLAADVGGVRHMVQDGVTGGLFPRGDHQALAGHLQTVLADAALRARWSNAARAFARAQYHPQRVAELTRAAYATILQSEPQP